METKELAINSLLKFLTYNSHIYKIDFLKQTQSKEMLK